MSKYKFSNKQTVFIGQISWLQQTWIFKSIENGHAKNQLKSEAKQRNLKNRFATATKIVIS
jgi:hypothetical protein